MMNINGMFDLTNKDFLERASFYKETLGLDIVPFFKKSTDLKAIQGNLVRSILLAVSDQWESSGKAVTLSENVNIRDSREVRESIRATAATISDSDIQKIRSICFTREKVFEYCNARKDRIASMVEELRKQHDKVIRGKITAGEIAGFMMASSAIAFGAAHLYATQAMLIQVTTPFLDLVARAAHLLVAVPHPVVAAIVAVIAVLGVVLAMMSVTKTVVCLVFNDTDHDMYTARWNEGAAGRDGDVYMEHGELTAFMEDTSETGKTVQIPKRTKMGNIFASFFITEKCFGFYGCESTIRFKFDGLDDTVTLLTACPYAQDNRINLRLNASKSCKALHSELYDSGTTGGTAVGNHLACSYHINDARGSVTYAIVHIREHNKEFIDFETSEIKTSKNLSLAGMNASYNGRYMCRHMMKGGSIKIRVNMDTSRPIRVSFNLCYVLVNASLDAPVTISVNGHPIMERLNARDWSFVDYSFIIPTVFLDQVSNQGMEIEIKQTDGKAGIFVKRIVLDYEDEQNPWSGYPNKNYWMREIPDSTKLSDINIPGTHDSAAINARGIHTPYACHSTTITQQLNNGIRLFDVRLKVKKYSAGSYYFVTCHGPLLSTFGINEYQTFVSLMDEFRDFLKKYPSEVLVVSLKMDDWNGTDKDKDAVLFQLRKTLASYPLSGRYDENVPIGQVRGKIYLLNRITNDLTFGAPVSWADAAEWQEANGGDKRKYKVYVQDKFKGLPFTKPEDEKYKLVVNAFSKKTDGSVILNYASACKLGIVGVYFTKQLLDYWLQKDAKDRSKKLGWLLMDYETELQDTAVYGKISVVDIYIDSNFGYRRYCYKSQTGKLDGGL